MEHGDEETSASAGGAHGDGKPEGGDAEADERLVVTSDELLQGRRELWIEHRGDMYRLRITSRGNLYLTK